MESLINLFDFDETLILDNSSRVFERIAFESYSGRNKKLIRYFYFGRGKLLVSAANFISGKVTNNPIDRRLSFFINHVMKKVNSSVEDIAKRVADELRPNPLIESYQQNEILVLSCGLDFVIESYFAKASINGRVIFGSQISRDGLNELLEISLRSPPDKIVFLKELVPFRYLTDSKSEVRIIKRNLGKSFRLGATTSIDNKIFIVELHN